MQLHFSKRKTHKWFTLGGCPGPAHGLLLALVTTWTSTVGGAEQVVSPPYVKGVALVLSWAGDSIL